MLISEVSKRPKYLLEKVFFWVFGLSLLIGLLFTFIVKHIYNNDDKEVIYIDEWTVYHEDGSSFKAGRTLNDKMAYDEDFTIVTTLPDDIENGIGTQFDPHFGEIMLEMIDEDKNYEMREK